MSLLRLAVRSLLYHRRIHAGLLAGVALACAILTGALVVGDSIDYTLRAIAAARLGRVAYALYRPNRLFDESLARKLREQPEGIRADAVLALSGMLMLPPERREGRGQINRVQVLGVSDGFWTLAEGGPPPAPPGPGEIALNEKAARALGVAAGDDVMLRVTRPGRMPLDAPLSSRKDEPAASSLVTVTAVVSDAHLGGFSLAANQTAPYNGFVDRSWLQELTGNERMVNLVLADGAATPERLHDAMDRSWDLEHIGLSLRRGASGIIQLESSQVFVDEEAVRAAMRIPGACATLTYLVNSISRNGRSTPYSFVQAGPVPAGMPDGETVISQWLADALGAAPGDPLELAYYRLMPDNTFAVERRTLTVHSVAPMSALALERDLAPRFPGLSDVESCQDWSIGMPLEKEALKDPANEAYWDAYGQTPKLLVTLHAGQEMWANRFGAVTAVRFPAGALDEPALRDRLRAGISWERAGLRFSPVKEAAMQAVRGATDFRGLFLGMSLFLIAAALIMLGLLYVFGLQHRASETALLTAVGFPRGKIAALLLLEALPTALLGAALGAAGGAGYARLLLAGLGRLWPAAVAGTAIRYHAGPARCWPAPAPRCCPRSSSSSRSCGAAAATRPASCSPEIFRPFPRPPRGGRPGGRSCFRRRRWRAPRPFRPGPRG